MFASYRNFCRKKLVQKAGHSKSGYVARYVFGAKNKLYLKTHPLIEFWGILIEYKYLVCRHKTYGLIKSSYGHFYYSSIPCGVLIGDFLKKNTCHLYTKSWYFFIGWAIKMSDLTQPILIFNIEVFGKIIYSKSPGTYCLPKFTKALVWGLFIVILPSTKKIYLTDDTYVRIGRVFGRHWHHHRFHKAGTSNFLGHKSIVRGVAKNAVDHPNGGRTKTNSPERSPWGWVAKLNK